MRSRRWLATGLGVLLCGLLVYAGADAASAAELIELPAGFTPRTLALSPDGSRLYVSSAQGGIGVIDTATGGVVTPELGPDDAPTGIVTSADGTHIYVSYLSLAQVLELDVATGAVTATIPLPESSEVRMLSTSDATHVYLSASNGDGSRIVVIDTATNAVTTSDPSPDVFDIVTASTDGSRIYASTRSTDPNTLMVLDPTSFAVLATTVLPPDANILFMQVSPDGSRVYAMASTGTGESPQLLSYGAGLETPTDLPLPGYGISLAVSPDGARVFLTDVPDNQISVVDTATNALLGTIPLEGTLPFDLTVSPDGKRVYVADLASNQIEILDAPVLAPITLADGDVAAAYSAQFTASTDIGPVTFHATGLPPGLTLDPATGALSGTPTVGGTFTIAVTATNLIGSTTATFTLAIAAPPELPATGAPDLTGTVGIACALLFAGLCLTVAGRTRRI